MRILIASLLALSHFAYGQKAVDQCDFKITCHPPKESEYVIEFKSASHDCLEDDSLATFSSQKTSSSLGLEKAWYFDIDNVGSEKSFCRSTHYYEYPAFPVASGKLLVFLRISNRPDNDKLRAVLLNPKTHKVEQSLDLGITMRTSTGIFKTPTGFKLPLIKDFIKEARCDCDASYIEGWLEITTDGTKLTKRWL